MEKNVRRLSSLQRLAEFFQDDTNKRFSSTKATTVGAFLVFSGIVIWVCRGVTDPERIVNLMTLYGACFVSNNLGMRLIAAKWGKKGGSKAW